MPENVLRGDQLAWSLVTEKETGALCREADARYDHIANTFSVQCFGQDIMVDPTNFTVSSQSPLGERLLHGLDHFFDLAVLWYLGSAKNIPPSGRMISPSGLSGGEIFQRGSHVLPLDRVVARYGDDFAELLRRGAELGGHALEYGDASLRLYPFPRVPVTFILWAADDEFPARADMFFDVTCEQHLPMDVIWATAMSSVLILL